jgi:hypothetical protein
MAYLLLRGRIAKVMVCLCLRALLVWRQYRASSPFGTFAGRVKASRSGAEGTKWGEAIWQLHLSFKVVHTSTSCWVFIVMITSVQRWAFEKQKSTFSKWVSSPFVVLDVVRSRRVAHGQCSSDRERLLQYYHQWPSSGLTSRQRSGIKTKSGYGPWESNSANSDIHYVIWWEQFPVGISVCWWLQCAWTYMSVLLQSSERSYMDPERSQSHVHIKQIIKTTLQGFLNANMIHWCTPRHYRWKWRSVWRIIQSVL